LKEEIGLQDQTIEELLKIESLREKLRKKKAKIPEKIRYKEFKVREFLFESIDYNEYARNVKERIEKGTFKIESIQDFIGLLFALQLYQIDIEDISQFLKKKYCLIVEYLTIQVNPYILFKHSYRLTL
jgi:hypothetical protein